jgi:ABC-type phosphate transport system auxiliary subunit
LFSPFIEQGAGLERFLRSCHPGMLVAMPDLHRAMQGLHGPEQVLQWMIDVSGLPVRLIGRLYAMQPLGGNALRAMDVSLGATSAEDMDSGISEQLAER